LAAETYAGAHSQGLEVIAHNESAPAIFYSLKTFLHNSFFLLVARRHSIFLQQEILLAAVGCQDCSSSCCLDDKLKDPCEKRFIKEQRKKQNQDIHCTSIMHAAAKKERKKNPPDLLVRE
jgi:hypothetical protein